MYSGVRLQQTAVSLCSSSLQGFFYRVQGSLQARIQPVYSVFTGFRGRQLLIIFFFSVIPAKMNIRNVIANSVLFCSGQSTL